MSTKEKPVGRVYPCGITQEQIDKWKTAARLKGVSDKIKIIKVVVDQESEQFLHCFVGMPDRKVLGAALQAFKFDPIKSKETLLNNCWLAGDNEIKTVDKYFLAASNQLDELLDTAEASVEEL